VSFLSPLSAAMVGWIGAAAALLTVTAYIIKMRRRRFEVPFSRLWQRVLDQKDASALWKHLRRLLSLLLALFVLGLFLLAALGPTLGGTDRRARSVVVLIDASASMKTLDGAPDGDGETAITRLDAAKRAAKELIDGMGGGDVAMILQVDGQATPLSRFSSDGPMLRKVVDGIRASDTPADLHRALGAAADALHGRQGPLLVIVSDGAYPAAQLAAVRWDAAAPTPATPPTAAEARVRAAGKDLAAVDLSGIDVRYLPVGRAKENVGIVGFAARRFVTNREELEVFVELQNFGAQPARRQLAIYSGDTAMDLQTIELAPGQRLRRIYKSAGNDARLRASLRPPRDQSDGAGSDPFPLDDEAFALLTERKRQKVLLVVPERAVVRDDGSTDSEASSLYLEGAMLALKDLLDADKITPAEYDANPAQASGYDAVIFDEHTPAAPPAAHAIYFHPTAEGSPVAVRGELERPRVTETTEEHPVMRWVQMSDVNVDRSHVFTVDRMRGEAALAISVRDPIVVARNAGGKKAVVVGFALAGTDLTLRVAFPLLLVNTLDWFAGSSTELITTYTTGQRQRVPLDGAPDVREATVTGPDGATRPAPVVDGVATFYADQVGFYALAAPGVAGLELAANLSSPGESAIAPVTRLALGDKELAAPEAFAVTRTRTLWAYLVLAALLLLVVEWVTYHRRITV
jgi:hypothetical protein